MLVLTIAIQLRLKMQIFFLFFVVSAFGVIVACAAGINDTHNNYGKIKLFMNDLNMTIYAVRANHSITNFKTMQQQVHPFTVGESS